MEKLKYTTSDTMVMVDAFYTLTKEGVTKEEMKEKRERYTCLHQ